MLACSDHSFDESTGVAMSVVTIQAPAVLILCASLKKLILELMNRKKAPKDDAAERP
jgi:hypothetical protein